MTWLSGYSKRQAITLTGGSSGAQVDFQLLLAIAYDSDMLSDFSDLRFTKEDGETLIDAWLEDKTDGTSADVWVEFPTTPANTIEQTYYMYYGKTDAVSDWDGAATFLQYHGAAASEYLDSLVITPSNIAYETKAKYLSNRPFFGLSNKSSIATDDSIFIYCTDDTLYLQSRNEGTSTYVEEAFTADNDYHKWLITISGGNAYGYYDGNEISSGGVSSNLPDETLGLVLDFYGTNNGEQDWSFARKYAANPPTYEFGSEESESGGLSILDFERAGMRGTFRGIMRGII